MNAMMFLGSPRGTLPRREVGWIAASVDRYRARWIEEGRYHADPEKQAERGRRSGVARRRRNALRDAHIRDLRAAGHSIRAIGSTLKLPTSTVQNALASGGGVYHEPTQDEGGLAGSFSWSGVRRTNTG